MTSRITNILGSALATLLCATPGFAENMTIGWTANTEPNIGGYRVSYGTSSGTHTTTVDVGNQTTARVSGLTAGQRYYFVVRAYDTAGRVSNPSTEVSGVALGVVALTANALSYPIPTGTPVTWTAVASSAQALEYQFARLNQASGTWTIVQAYSPQNTFTWTPALSQQGTYAMRVWVRVPGSSEPFDARRETAPFTVANGSLVIGSLEADVAFPAATGSPITFKARATGGPGPLQYRFYRLNMQTNTWTMARDYSTADRFTWTPAAGDEGRHSVQVWVRRAGSTATYDALRTSDPVTIANLTPIISDVRASASFPAGSGTPITWTVTAGGGPGPLHYRFYRLSRATNTWTMVQDYGPSNSFTWTPTPAQQGTYVIQAWVRRSGSTVFYDGVYSTSDFTIEDAPPVIRSVTSDGGIPTGTGAPVTWTVDAIGGPGPLQYGFSLYRVATDSWSAVQGYSSKNTFTWLPGPWDAGSYLLQVSVSRPGTSTAEAVRTTAFDVAANTLPGILAITRATGPTLKPGMPIVWTATAAGGGTPLEYLFARYNSATQQWTTVQAYSWDNSYGWVPTPNELGSYVLAVFIRRSGSTAAYERVAYTSTFIVN